MQKKHMKKTFNRLANVVLLLIFTVSILMVCNIFANHKTIKNGESINNDVNSCSNEKTENNEDVESDTYVSNEEDNITKNEPTIEPTPELNIEEDVEIPVVYNFDVNGYTTANLNIRTETNIECEILDVLPKYTEIQFSYLEDNDEEELEEVIDHLSEIHYYNEVNK